MGCAGYVDFQTSHAHLAHPLRAARIVSVPEDLSGVTHDSVRRTTADVSFTKQVLGTSGLVAQATH